MPDHIAIQQAFRVQLLTLSVSTTGSTSLSATATGYARAAGSFLTDGFFAGMELVASGFSVAGNNGVKIVRGVTATTLDVTGGATAEAAGAGKTLAVGPPGLRAWENIAFTPVPGRPYLEEEYVPATSTLISFPAAGGSLEDTGLYVVRWYGLAGLGPEAMAAGANALLTLFKPGTSLLLASGLGVRVLNPGPHRGAIRADLPGWSVVSITIPWRFFSLNT